MRVARVDVHEVAVFLDLSVEERDESCGHARVVDDAVQLLHRPHDLEIPLDAHAQARVDVAHLQRGGQAVARGVSDGDAHDAFGDRYEIEEVAPDELRRIRVAGHLDGPLPERAPRQDRHLDLPRLVQGRDVPRLPQLLVHGMAQDTERGHEVFVGRPRVDREGQDELVVPHRDRRKPIDTERPFELRIDARRIETHDDDAVLEDPIDWGIGVGDEETGLDGLDVPEGADQLVAAVAGLVEARAAHAERALEMFDDGRGRVRHRRRGVGRLANRLHRLLHPAEEAFPCFTWLHENGGFYLEAAAGRGAVLRSSISRASASTNASTTILPFSREASVGSPQMPVGE